MTRTRESNVFDTFIILGRLPIEMEKNLEAFENDLSKIRLAKSLLKYRKNHLKYHKNRLLFRNANGRLMTYPLCINYDFGKE